MQNAITRITFRAAAGWLAVLAITGYLVGCSGSADLTADVLPAPSMLAGLPPLPQDGEGDRLASQVVEDTIFGFDTWDNTSGVMIDGNNLQLPAMAGEIQWSMYRYTLPSLESSLDTIAAALSATGGDGAWLAASDYGSGQWEINGPYSANPEVSLADGEFLSEMGYFYALVIAFDGTTVDLASTSLTYDDGVEPPAVTYAGSGGAREFFAANCFGCHSAQAATAGVVLESYSGASAVADTAKGKVQNDHNGSYSTEDKELIAAWADAGAPLGDAVHYTTEMLPQVFELACLDCHSSTLSGPARQGAPPTVNWDTYAAASTGNQPNRGNTRAQAGTMPPGFSGLSLTPAQKALFQDWIDDGWPE